MCALNGAPFHLTEKIMLTTLNIDGKLSKRMICTCIHFSWKDKMLSLPATEMQNEVMTWTRCNNDPKGSGLENCFIKLITGWHPLNI